MTPDLSVYLVTDAGQCRRHGRDVVATVEAAVVGGVTAVQVREKHAPAREILALVEALGARLPGHVTLLVNDRIDVFQAAHARGVRVDGVHVGQCDIPVRDVRALVGPDAVVGLSVSSPEQLAEAEAAGADYVGVGAVNATTSKDDPPPPIGVDGVARLVGTMPVVAIGGITPADVGPLHAAGVAGVAVVSWVCDSPDPRGAAAALVRAWEVAA